MKKLHALLISAVVSSGCAVTDADKEGLSPFKNKNGEEVVYVDYINIFNKEAANTAPAANVGSLVAPIIGMTPIVGAIVGSGLAAAGSAGKNVPWVRVSVRRGAGGADWKRMFPDVYRPYYQEIRGVKERTWVLYKKDGEGRPIVYACEIADDCLPVSQQ